MFRIVMPDNCVSEREWICAVIFDQWLGIPYTIAYENQTSSRIEANGKALVIDDSFFQGASTHWLLPQSMPIEPLACFDVSDFKAKRRFVRPTLPVIYGKPTWLMEQEEGSAYLGLDVFGSAFFMLSRYEEAVGLERDKHGRFSADLSMAFRGGFLGRPVVDEYIEVLWECMDYLWPGLHRRKWEFRMSVTCDVDQPFHPGADSFPRTLRRTLGQLYRRESLEEIAKPALNYLHSRSGNWSYDPYYLTIDWMMEVNEAAGNQVAFYFIPEITDPVMDDTCTIENKAVRSMLKRIANRGHEIGIHPGYRTWDNAALMQSGLRRLKTVLEQEKIDQSVKGGRQHFLRWNITTPRIWSEAGMCYDSTLGYADIAGFRCGTSREYQMYDLHRRYSLAMTQRPLIVMEGTVFEYMGLGVSDQAARTFDSLKNAVRTVNGNFVMLWHNSSFTTKGARQFYCDVIKG